MTNHIHIYIVEAPKGPRSNGQCKECGHQKEFGNSVEEVYKMTHGDDANLYNQYKGKEKERYQNLDGLLRQLD